MTNDPTTPAGERCEKAPHIGTGHLHAEDDDSPYSVDGVLYCGRCHYAMPCTTPAGERRYGCPDCGRETALPSCPDCHAHTRFLTPAGEREAQHTPLRYALIRLTDCARLAAIAVKDEDRELLREQMITQMLRVEALTTRPTPAPAEGEECATCGGGEIVPDGEHGEGMAPCPKCLPPTPERQAAPPAKAARLADALEGVSKYLRGGEGWMGGASNNAAAIVTDLAARLLRTLGAPGEGEHCHVCDTPAEATTVRYCPECGEQWFRPGEAPRVAAAERRRATPPAPEGEEGLSESHRRIIAENDQLDAWLAARRTLSGEGEG